MAKKKSTSAGLSASLNLLAAARGVLLGMTLAALLVGGAGFGFHKLRQYTERNLAYPPSRPIVVMKNRPAWMSDALATQITSSVQPRAARSAMDHQLLKEVAESLQHNPWIRQVHHVRRLFKEHPGDRIEIDCEYRVPLALVPYRNEYILVDSEGVKLPERFPTKDTPRILYAPDGRVNLRIIEGVAANPPFLDGQKWPGEDLQAGLDLAKLLYDKPFADEIHRVNVANFRCRKHPKQAQLVLITKYNTEVRWGAPLRGPINFEVPPTRKLQVLATTYETYKRVDANYPWIDIRLDKVEIPESAPLVRADAAHSKRVDN